MSATTRTRVDMCENCGGVMRSVWSDGKTRIHKMDCVSCDATAERHSGKLEYIECKHGDAFADLPVEEMDYGDFISRFTEYRREQTNRAFTPEASSWRVVRLHRGHHGSYTVSAYSTFTEEGEGVGVEENLPHGAPDVSWSTPTVYLNESKFEAVNVNEGSAWLFLTYVDNIQIGQDDEFVRIHL